MSFTRLFFRKWQNWLSLLLVSTFIFAAIAAPMLSSNDPDAPGPFKTVGRAVEARPLPPDEKAILGMLPRGVDVYHALIWGTRDALKFGLLVTLFSALFGIRGSRVASGRNCGAIAEKEIWPKITVRQASKAARF